MSNTSWLLSSRFSTVPESLLEVPGVWPKKDGNGYIVPYNTIFLWDKAMVNASEVPRLLTLEAGTQALRSMFDDPRFKWPHPLFAHQHSMLFYSLTRPGSTIWAPPASGKTVVGIKWLMYERSGDYLVICKSANISVWKAEILKWTRIVPNVLSGATADKSRVDLGPRSINIIAWEVLHYWFDVLKDMRFSRVVMDESHMAKNPRRVRPSVDEHGETTWESKENWSDFASRLSRNIPYRLCMTGTPIANTRLDLYAQLDLAEPFCWGTPSGFGMRYLKHKMTQWGPHYEKEGQNNEELKARIRFSACRISNAEVRKTLPPFRRQRIDVPLSEQNKVTVWKRRAGEVPAPTDAGYESSAREFLIWEAACRKRDAVMKAAFDQIVSGQKICILTGRQNDCEELYIQLSKRLAARFPGAPVHVYHADGTIAQEERDKRIESYMAVERKEGKPGAALIGTGYALGTGLNLQDTDIAHIVMLPVTPEAILQWERRFVRPGRTEPVLICYWFAEGTIDEDMREILFEKLPDLQALLDDTDATALVDNLKIRHKIPLLQRMQMVMNRNANHDKANMTAGDE